MIETIKTIGTMGLQNILKIKKSSDLAERYLQNFIASQVLFTLFNIGFLDKCVENKVNIQSFAKENQLDERVLRSLCDYLYSLKILKKIENEYSLDSIGEILVKRSRGLFDLWYAYQPVLYNLESILKKERLYGKDIVRREKYVAKGSGKVGKFLTVPLVINIIQEHNFKKILDLGCGDAEFLISLCENNANHQCIGIDISPEAVAHAKERIKKKNLEDRIKICEGDIFDLDKVTDKLDADVLTSFFVLHEFLFSGDEKIVKFFKKCKKLFEGKYLIICEFSRQTNEELRMKPSLNLDYQLIHDLTNQGLISREEWKGIFKKTGYTLIKEKYIDFSKLCIFVVR